jgi:hypothetical protein
MAVSFTLTLGVMLWQQRKESAPAPSAAAAPRVAPSPPPVRGPPPTAAATPPAIVPGTAAGSPTQDADDTPDAASQMPVETAFHPRRNKWIGRIASTSGDPLYIEVRVRHSATSRVSVTEVNVAPGAAATIGQDDDLNIQTGDQVTLRTAPYADKVFTIGNGF